MKISREFVTMQALGVFYAVAVNVNPDSSNNDSNGE